MAAADELDKARRAKAYIPSSDEVIAAEKRQAAGELEAGDEVLLSHAVSRGVAPAWPPPSLRGAGRAARGRGGGGRGGKSTRGGEFDGGQGGSHMSVQAEAGASAVPETAAAPARPARGSSGGLEMIAECEACDEDAWELPQEGTSTC